MVKYIRTSGPRRLKKKTWFGIPCTLPSLTTPEEDPKAYRPKGYKCNNKVEVNSPKTLNDKNSDLYSYHYLESNIPMNISTFVGYFIPNTSL